MHSTPGLLVQRRTWYTLYILYICACVRISGKRGRKTVRFLRAYCKYIPNTECIYTRSQKFSCKKRVYENVLLSRAGSFAAGSRLVIDTQTDKQTIAILVRMRRALIICTRTRNCKRKSVHVPFSVGHAHKWAMASCSELRSESGGTLMLIGGTFVQADFRLPKILA